MEAIVHSASKKDKCAGLLNDAVPVLKKLYQESIDTVKVRALVVSSDLTFRLLPNAFCGQFDCNYSKLLQIDEL